MRSAIRRYGVLVSLTILLVVSLAANGVLAWLVRGQYRAVLHVRLDPTSESAFVPMNSALKPAPPGIRRVVFAGDSRTEMWRDLPSVEGCEMVNRGRSHDTSGQLLLRIERDVIALKPDLVVLEIGANDLKSIGVFAEEERLIKDRLRANRSAILDRLGRNGIPAIVSTSFPFGDVSLARRPVWSDRIVEAREEMNREIRALRRAGVTVFDADLILSTNGRLKPEYQSDELHLNAAAYRSLNEALAPVIKTAAAGR